MGKLTKPCATSWLSSASSPTTVVVDGYQFSQDARGIQAAIDSITDSGVNKPYTVLLRPGVYNMNWDDTSVCTDMTGTTSPFSAATGGKDYIGIVGEARDRVILERSTAAGALTALLQGSPNTYLANLTLRSPVTRHVHWDTVGTLQCDNVSFESTGTNSAGLSTGIQSTSTVRSFHRIVNCHFAGTQYAVHGGPDAAGALQSYIWITGNTWNASGTIIGLGWDEASGSDASLSVFISGNVQREYNVDPGAGGISITLNSDDSINRRLRVYTDGSLRINDGTSTDRPILRGIVMYPQARSDYRLDSAKLVDVGDVFVYRHDTGMISSASANNAQWPISLAVQEDYATSGQYWPRICTGPFSVARVGSSMTVVLGDTLVATAIATYAGVDNTQTDFTRILGWAQSAKSFSTATGYVDVRRNQTFGW